MSVKSPRGTALGSISYEAKYAALKAIMNAVGDASSEIVLQEFRRTIMDRNIKGSLNELMPYLYAAGFLSYASREIDKQGVANVMKSIGLKPNSKLIDVILKSSVTSHLAYIYAYYYILANGRIASAEDISKVITAIGMKPDKARIKEVMEFISRH